jgi:hypothetical protein
MQQSRNPSTIKKDDELNAGANEIYQRLGGWGEQGLQCTYSIESYFKFKQYIHLENWCRFHNALILDKNNTFIENVRTPYWVIYFGVFSIFGWQTWIEMILLAVGSEEAKLANWLRIVSTDGLSITADELPGFILRSAS